MSTFLVMSMHETGFSCADMRGRTCSLPAPTVINLQFWRGPHLHKWVWLWDWALVD